MATRTTRKTIPAGITIEEVEVNCAHEADTPKQGFAYDYLRMMGVTPDRTGIAALVVSTIVQIAGSYLVWDFLSGMAVVALLGTGSMFLTFLVSLLAAILAAVLGGIAGFATFKYIATGRAAEHVNKAKGFVSGLFSRKTEINAA